LSGLKVKNLKKIPVLIATGEKSKLIILIALMNKKTILVNQQTPLHHAEAEEAFNSKRNDISTSTENTCVIAFLLHR